MARWSWIPWSIIIGGVGLGCQDVAHRSDSSAKTGNTHSPLTVAGGNITVADATVGGSPSKYGDPVTFTASFSGDAAVTAADTIDFKYGCVDSTTGSLVVDD